MAQRRHDDRSRPSVPRILTRSITCTRWKNFVPLQLPAKMRPVSGEGASCTGPDLHYSQADICIGLC